MKFFKINHPAKPEELHWLPDNVWSNLNLKQKDYYIFKYVEFLPKIEIMRRLYLTNSNSFANFLVKIKKINKNIYKN